MESGVGARASGGRRLLWPLIGVGFALGVVAVAVVLLTRTGGGPSLFDLPRTKACLDRSARVAATSTRKGDVDYIARDAGVGAIAVRADGTFKRYVAAAAGHPRLRALLPGPNLKAAWAPDAVSPAVSAP